VSSADAQRSPVNRELTIVDGDLGEMRIRVGGTWRIGEGVPDGGRLLRSLSERPVSAVSFEGREVTSWDSSLVAFVHGLSEQLRQRGVAVDTGGLPDGVRHLLALASVRPETAGAGPAGPARSWLSRLGDSVLGETRTVRSELGMLGEVTRAFGRFLVRRSRARRVDIVAEIKEAGARALPIVTLTSFLLGMIMAFVGAAALRPFGAGIYVANVVALAMVRELSAVLTGIVMAGRTGSAYAAQLATMNLTQELDALQTMGVEPSDFLVLPRMIALSLMLPLLCVYADFVGIIGGGLVAISMLDLTAEQYLNQTRTAVSLGTFFLGVGKSAAFGVLVAFLGCRAGLQAGRSAATVGRAATTAMVTSIVAIIVADGVFAVMFHALGI
jgi:phospholipid/cholesterol/gamma-HCH transport system permease protein